MSPSYHTIVNWFNQKGWRPFSWQTEVWEKFRSGSDGLLNAPTGTGKTLALFMPVLMQWMDQHPETWKTKKGNGLQLLWITPLRALARDLEQAMSEVTKEIGLPWSVQRRTGDVSQSVKQKQKKQMPEVLIITPESLHVLLSQKGYPARFKLLQSVVVDEWHELLGSKRGTQTELALSRLRGLNPGIKVWGVSATIGNMDEALETLTGYTPGKNRAEIVHADVTKDLNIHTVIPDEMENFPWHGHLGLNLLHKILPIIRKSNSTLIFTNTRSQTEIWFQKLLEACPNLAGSSALHHGSLDRKMRNWVESSLHAGELKAVVCTSSLDLGVDFSPVETVIQIGSPKGIARFIQRAGRSGHQPGAASNIYFVPTHALELFEASALKEAAKSTTVENRAPVLKPYDVLVQYLVTLAVSEGFRPDQIYDELKHTFSYQTLNPDEWSWILNFITTGGTSLTRYDEYSKVSADEDGIYRVMDKKTARRHRMTIGTIGSDSMLRVKYLKGGNLGMVEEWFLSRLKSGDTFWFAGRNLELVYIRQMTAYVRRSKGAATAIPSWQGGRMSLSSNLSELLRKQIDKALDPDISCEEFSALKPIIDIQKSRSVLPRRDQFLIEKSCSREGCHCFIYPFEGRKVHEGLSALLAWRISQKHPITFSIAMNDYGFELLSDRDIPVGELLDKNLYSEKNLLRDIMSGLNSTELARRRFRDISQIAGLVFPGYPGNQKAGKHLQMSSGLFFDVFREFEPGHLLLQQAYDEVLQNQLDESRIRAALKRIRSQEIVFKETKKFTPLAFPVFVDRLRQSLSSEKLDIRIKKIQKQLETESR